MKTINIKKEADVYKILWEIKNPTFIFNRECLFCKRQIPDQARPNQIYCPDYRDEKGKVRSCRSKFHAIKHGPENEILKDQNYKHKDILYKLEEILKIHGEKITTDILNAYDIDLSDRMSIEYDTYFITSHFLKYKIKTNLFFHTHQIIKYG